MAEVLDSRADEFAKLLRAIRFAFSALTCGIGYFNIRVALLTKSFHQMYRDMLGNKPLPASTQFLIDHQTAFLILSYACPAIVIGCIFVRNRTLPFYIFGVVIIVVFAQFFSQLQFLFDPFLSIIQGMQGGPQ